MAKGANGTFYATVVIDSLGAETVLYNGAKEEQMKKQFASMLKSWNSYTKAGELFTVWNYDEGKEMLAMRLEQREYQPSQYGSVDRRQKGLKGQYNVLAVTTFVEGGAQ